MPFLNTLKLWAPSIQNVLYALAVVLCSILLGLIFTRENRASQKCWLSYRIREAKAELRGKCSLEQKFYDFIYKVTQLYYPTWEKLGLLVGFLILILVGSLYFPFIQHHHSDKYLTLVPVQIGLVALVFPILIFIIGFSNNKPAYGINLSEVLLKESFLFPVGVVALFFSVDLIWVKKTPIIIGQIISMAIIYAWVLVRIIRLILSEPRLFLESCALLKDRMKRAIINTIDKRLGDNILMERLGEKKIELEYTYLDLKESGQEYVRFGLKHKGAISNINLGTLDRIAKVIEESGRLNGFSFYKNMPDPNISTEASISEEKRPLVQCTERYIRKRFKEAVDEDAQYILSVNKKLIRDGHIQSQIEHLVSKTFRFKKSEEDNLDKELSNLKDQLIDDIRNRRIGRINQLRRIYLLLGEVFLDIMKDYSSNYGMDMAIRERKSVLFSQGWPHLDDIFDDLEDIYDIAIETKDRGIIRKLGYLPIALTQRSIKSMDHLMFQKSFRFVSIFYHRALELEKKGEVDLSSTIKEKLVTDIRETADYFIQFEISNHDLGRDKIVQYKNFTIEIYLQVQELLKQAYLANDIHLFNKLLVTCNNLLSEFHPSGDHPYIADLEWRLQSSNLAQADKDVLDRRIKDKQFLVSVEDEIKFKRWEMLFGLASWILGKYATDKTNKEILNYFKAISPYLPSSLEDLTKVFLNTQSHDVTSFWHWDWWDAPPSGEVYFVDFNSKTLLLYAVKVLDISSRLSDVQIANISLPTTRDFVLLVDNDESSLKKTIESILKEIGVWQEVINTAAIKKDAIYSLFDKAKEKQMREDEDALIEAEISKEKTAEFIDIFLEAYHSSNTLYRIFEKYNALKIDLTNFERPPDAYGYNQLDEKGAFVEKWHVGYHRWGEQYGTGMATSENNSILSKMCDSSTFIELRRENILSQVEDAIEQLISKGYKPDLVIASLNFDDLRGLTENAKFTPRWHKDITEKNDIPNFHGILRLKQGAFPLYKIYRSRKQFIGIFGLKKFAKLTILNPLSSSEDGCLYDKFTVEVLDLNKADLIRNDILLKNPDWLNKYGDKNRFLRTKAVIKTFMREELQLLDKNAAIVLK